MATYKINYMKENGRIYSRKVKASSKKEASTMTHYVIIGIYKINEVGAIIG